jgi:hypothetical protein
MHVSKLDRNIGSTARALSDGQHRLRWSAGESSHDVPLAPLRFHKSARAKPILQSTVLTYVRPTKNTRCGETHLRSYECDC